ncbi:hypothetical protein OS189_10560 [Sulfitobacter sp. F26169L]|uniref:hypothetical protein n=1 Tax=Sulfitobacter sp. F26169L TaxID=2996015 RepID=UPI002260E161|nr:hypothetical protein [Sulfitobacter sp. F26169L]MCX7566782.1 hypothetical protein [Sulfitobacter sp. F26169L]
MTMVTLQSGDRFVANSTEIFHQYGVQLEVGYDFEAYREILKYARPDQTLGAPFDPDVHKLTPQNALWVIGRNADGEIVHTQALRMLEMKNQSIAEYFTHNFRDFPPAAPNLDLARSRYRASPKSKRMFGSVCYNGEFWIKPGDDSLRGQGFSCVLGRYAFCQALQHWNPDHMIGLMAKPVACKGFPQRLGWMNSQPGALRWFFDGRDAPVEGFMVFMDREDMHYVLELPLNDLVALAA